jgi:hypothetical protein
LSHSGRDGARSGRHERHSEEHLRLVHHHPGYLRVQADAFVHPEDDSPVVTAAQAAAEDIPGFRSWTLKPKTGSVVIEYDPSKLDADDLLKHIAKGAGLRGVEASTSGKMNREELVGAFLNAVQGLNQVVGRLTGERADLRELVPVALAATSVVSLVLGKNRGRLPSWGSAFYHSYRVFMQWHKKEVRIREKLSQKNEEDESSASAETPE